MVFPFDYPMADGRRVADVVMAPLEARGIQPMVIDAGARNGMVELPPGYAARSHYVGFEPNEDEHRKLVTGTTDAAAANIHMPKFLEQSFHPTALWDSAERRPFYITTGTGACTLMGPPDMRIAGKMCLDGVVVHGEAHTQVLTTTEVPCQSLDSLYPPETKIDYLKIDVEGAEVRLMNGARNLFAAKSVLFMKTEFVMLPYYGKDHPLLAHQHVFLHEHGLRLIDLDLNHNRYTRGPSKLSESVDRRLIQAGDAFFALDPDLHELSAEDRHRMGAIALALRFHSFGLSLLREAKLLTLADLDMIEAAIAREPVLRRLKRAWMSFPLMVAGAVNRFR